MVLSPPLSIIIRSSVGSFCSISSMTARLIDGSSRTAVWGQPPVAIPIIMSSGMSLASVARVRCILSASSFDTTSFDIMQQRYPCLLNNGTICSISRVLPEPTGPPIPTLGIGLATAEHRTSLCNKHSQLGPFVLHLHDFCQWRQLPQLANVPSHLCRINVARKLRQETLAFNVGNDAEPDCRSNDADTI